MQYGAAETPDYGRADCHVRIEIEIDYVLQQGETTSDSRSVNQALCHEPELLPGYQPCQDASLEYFFDKRHQRNSSYGSRDSETGGIGEYECQHALL